MRFVLGHVLGASALALCVSVGCSGPTDDESREWHFEGRYAIKSASATYSTIWFGKDGRFEGVVAKTRKIESGSYTARGPVTRVKLDSGLEFEFRADSISGERVVKSQIAPKALRLQSSAAGRALPLTDESSVELSGDTMPCKLLGESDGTKSAAHDKGAEFLGPADLNNSDPGSALLDGDGSPLIAEACSVLKVIASALLTGTSAEEGVGPESAPAELEGSAPPSSKVASRPGCSPSFDRKVQVLWLGPHADVCVDDLCCTAQINTGLYCRSNQASADALSVGRSGYPFTAYAASCAGAELVTT